MTQRKSQDTQTTIANVSRLKVRKIELGTPYSTSSPLYYSVPFIKLGSPLSFSALIDLFLSHLEFLPTVTLFIPS